MPYIQNTTNKRHHPYIVFFCLFYMWTTFQSDRNNTLRSTSTFPPFTLNLSLFLVALEVLPTFFFLSDVSFFEFIGVTLMCAIVETSSNILLNYDV